MQFKFQVITLTSIPVILIFVSALVSQYIALLYTREQIENYQNGLFEDQIMFSKTLTQTISNQLGTEVQKMVFTLNLQNHFYSKVLAGQVNFNSGYHPAIIHSEAFYFDLGTDPQLFDIFRNHVIQTTVWYHKNASSLAELSNSSRDTVINATYNDALLHAIMFENSQKTSRFQFKDSYFGYQQDGMLYSSAANSTFKNLTPPPLCGTGRFNFDSRCRYWYSGAINAESLIIYKPGLFFSDGGNPFLSTVACQKLLRYNQTTDSDDLYLVACNNIQLKKMESFFQNFARSTKQSYLIEPRSQIIVYDSSVPAGRSTISTLSQVEYQYLESQESATKFNETLTKNFSSFIVKRMNENSDFNEIQSMKNEASMISYDRNGTIYKAILNPVYVIDKLPQFKGVKNSYPRGFQVALVYLQINLISDDDLRKQSLELREFFNNYFNIIIICLSVFGLCSLYIIIYYSLRISYLLINPIEQLTKILENISVATNVREFVSLFATHRVSTKDLFLSYETRELFESFETVFRMLQYTSENFFSTNKTTVLLSLNAQVEFFKKFRNHHATGICHNNIGLIFLTSHDFFLALEHFAAAIIYARYEIQEFCKQNPSKSASNMHIFAFEDPVPYMDINEEPQQQNAAIPKSQTFPRISVNSHNRTNQIHQPSIYKKNSNTTQLQIKNKSPSDPESLQGDPQFQISSFHNYINENQFQYIPSQQQDQSQQHPRETLYSQYGLEHKGNAPPKLQARIFNEQQEGMHRKTKRLQKTDDEQIQELLENLYHRKKNYAIALISFQEHLERNIKVSSNKHITPTTEINSHLQQSKDFNFWPEIEYLFRELIGISRVMGSSISKEVILLTLISKCQLKQGNLKEAKETVEFGKSLLEVNPSKSQFQSTYIQTNSKILQKIFKDSNRQKQKHDEIQAHLEENRQYTDSFSSRIQANRSNDIKGSNTSDINNIGMASKTSRRKNSNSNLVHPIKEDNLPPRSASVNDRFTLQSNKQIIKQINFLQTPAHLEPLYSPGLKPKSFSQQQQHIFFPTRQKPTNSSEQISRKLIQPHEEISTSRRTESISNPLRVKSLDTNHLNHHIQDNDNLSINGPINTEQSQRRRHQGKSQNPIKPTQADVLVKLKEDNALQRIAQRAENIDFTSNFWLTLDIRREIQNVFDESETENELENHLAESAYCFLRLSLVEYYFIHKNYRKSISILTKMLETNKTFMSQVPFFIIHKLKVIFMRLNWVSPQLNRMFSIFNPEISFDIAFCFYNTTSTRATVSQLNLLNDIIWETSQSPRDRIAINLLNQIENSLQIYMPFIQSKNIISLAQKIVEDIKYSISTHSTESLIFADSDTSLNAQNDSISSASLLSELQVEGSSSNQRLSIIKSPFMEATFSQRFGGSRNIASYNNNTQIHTNQHPVYFTEGEEEIHLNTMRGTNDQLNSNPTARTLLTQEQANLQFGITLPDSPVKNQVKRLLGPEIAKNNENNIPKIQETLKQIQKPNMLSEDNSRNNIFHMLIMHTIQTQFANKFNHQAEILINRQKKEENQTEPKLVPALKKYIIYCTDEIEIQNNQLFQSLNTVLEQQNLSILILSLRKGQNFLETLPPTSNHQNQKDTQSFRCFYSVSNLVNFLKSQRSKITTHYYPTSLQHF